MDSNDDGTVPTDGTSGQLAAMTDVQLTMARAQLAMAEALLALSKGIVQSGPRSADAPEDVATFMHTGILASDLPLTFVDFQGPQRSLESLAECRKRIQLEFELSPESEYAARSEADKAVFLALGNFLLCGQRR